MNKTKLPELKQLAIMYPDEVSSLANEIKNLIGIDNTISIFNHFGGNSVYFTSLRSAFSKCIKRYYQENKNNITVQEIIKHYGYANSAYKIYDLIN